MMQMPIGFVGFKYSEGLFLFIRINETEIAIYTPWFGVWIADGAYEFARLSRFYGMHLYFWPKVVPHESIYKYHWSWVMRSVPDNGV